MSRLRFRLVDAIKGFSKRLGSREAFIFVAHLRKYKKWRDRCAARSLYALNLGHKAFYVVVFTL